MKILKIQNHVGQNADKVWKGMIFSFRPHLGPSQTMFSMDQKTKHAYQKKARAAQEPAQSHHMSAKNMPVSSKAFWTLFLCEQPEHQCGCKVAQQLCRNMACSKYGEAARWSKLHSLITHGRGRIDCSAVGVSSWLRFCIVPWPSWKSKLTEHTTPSKQLDGDT